MITIREFKEKLKDKNYLEYFHIHDDGEINTYENDIGDIWQRICNSKNIKYKKHKDFKFTLIFEKGNLEHGACLDAYGYFRTLTNILGNGIHDVANSTKIIICNRECGISNFLDMYNNKRGKDKGDYVDSILQENFGNLLGFKDENNDITVYTNNFSDYIKHFKTRLLNEMVEIL